MNRRQFIKTGIILISGLTLLPSFRLPKKTLKFGWVTDIHYADADIKWGRYFRESTDKLQEAIDLFNTKELDFIIETGDFKDQTTPPVEENTLVYLRKIEAVFAKYKGPRYHVLGNHDMDSLSKSQFLNEIENTDIEKDKSFYYFDKNDMRFVVLDACYTKRGKDYDHHNYSWKDANIPKHQLLWLTDVLQSSPYPVVVFVHQLLDGKGDLYVNNSSKVRKILENSGNVLAVFQGHKHEGDLQLINGIVYFTLKAMVEGSGEQNSSYSIVSVEPSGTIKVEGYRKAESYELNKS
ncbi:metallophosphoesterase [Plebeiibacterium sediminum]|uniref:Metallophosphoesterase n=1 Tax=Plebeiibacterium sediminum TaxID=2992112 RepID=A0AAE3SFG0_9BACT|nr:metallophosphoesterase [Plebeiobacterium sediminum]MCW3787393.1 metallophosphoesterase [Plebeiobacterium sediminum]